jgi:class 3 adenylate cyclase
MDYLPRLLAATIRRYRRYRTVPRRLSAILIADVVGYSRLVETDEVGTLAALKQRWKTILESVVREWGGRIVKENNRRDSDRPLTDGHCGGGQT